MTKNDFILQAAADFLAENPEPLADCIELLKGKSRARTPHGVAVALFNSRYDRVDMPQAFRFFLDEIEERAEKYADFSEGAPVIIEREGHAPVLWQVIDGKPFSYSLAMDGGFHPRRTTPALALDFFERMEADGFTIKPYF